MTPEEPAKRAAERIAILNCPCCKEDDWCMDPLLAEIRAAVAEEREACARVAEMWAAHSAIATPPIGVSPEDVPDVIAAVIRARR